MQLALVIQQVTVHGGAAQPTAVLVEQLAGFRLLVLLGIDRFITGNQVAGSLAALGGGQGIA